MTDQITPVFFRVIRPLFAALLGLTFVQAVGSTSEKVSQVCFSKYCRAYSGWLETDQDFFCEAAAKAELMS